MSPLHQSVSTVAISRFANAADFHPTVQIIAFYAFCSMLHQIQVLQATEGGCVQAGSPMSVARSSTLTTPPDGASLMLSTPSAATPQSTTHPPRSGRGGSPNSRGCQGRQQRVSIAGNSVLRNGLSTHRESQWHPPTAALQQVRGVSLSAPP